MIIFCFKIWKSELTFLCPNYKSKPFSHQLSHPLSTFIEVEVEVNRNLSESRLRMGIRSCWSSSSSEDKMTTNWYICKPSSTWLNFKFAWSFDCAFWEGKVIQIQPQPYLIQPLDLQDTMSEPVWKVAVNRNFDFQSFAICQNFRKKMNEDVHNLPDDEPSIFFDVHMRLWCTFCNGVGI